MDEHDVIERKIQNAREARMKAADGIGAVFEWAFAAAKAFPENVGAVAWQSGGTLILHYDAHDAVLMLGVRAADGMLHTLHAVSADRHKPAIFGRPLDTILLAALEGMPMPSAKPLADAVNNSGSNGCIYFCDDSALAPRRRCRASADGMSAGCWR